MLVLLGSAPGELWERQRGQAAAELSGPDGSVQLLLPSPKQLHSL